MFAQSSQYPAMQLNFHCSQIYCFFYCSSKDINYAQFCSNIFGLTTDNSPLVAVTSLIMRSNICICIPLPNNRWVTIRCRWWWDAFSLCIFNFLINASILGTPQLHNPNATCLKNTRTLALHDETQRCKYKRRKTKINSTMHIEHTPDSNSITWEMSVKKTYSIANLRPIYWNPRRINSYALTN